VKQLKSDIVVISAGTAGLPAAVTATEGDASVIVLEKSGRIGGATYRGNSLFACESRLHRANPPVKTREECFHSHMMWTHWRTDPRLVSTWINKSGSTIDWLEDMGVKFGIMGKGPFGEDSTCLMVKGAPSDARQIGQAYAMSEVLAQRAKDLGVQFLMKTTANNLIKKGKKITGVIANDQSGKEIKVSAGAVIIATGGFPNNKDWVKKYTGYEDGKDYVSLHKAGLTGDGIRMAWEAGAAATPMMIGLTHNLPPPLNGAGGATMEFAAFTKPTNIMVDTRGERFCNEDFITSHGGAAAHGTVASVIALQKGKAGFMIFDGNLKNYYAGVPNPMAGMFAMYIRYKHENLDDNIRDVLATGYKYLFMADSLEELCAQTGIDPNGLKNTITEYNRACEKGRDDAFHKDPKYLMPIKGQPKWYAGKMIAGAYGTSGGIKINHKMEVLAPNFDAIPGLYAAGNDANNMYDHSYTPLNGSYISFAVNSGRIAAESALEYIKSL
jgi:fumarate reductase flavoprotein subunit